MVLTTFILCCSVTCGWAEDPAAVRDEPDPKAPSNAGVPTPPDGQAAPSAKQGLTGKQCIAEEQALAAQLRADYPDSEEAWLFAARVHRGHGRSAEAAKCWEQALRINPGRATTSRELGELARAKGQFEQAVEYWRKALQIRPELVYVRANLADALMELGKWDEALAELQWGTGGEPQIAAWHYMKGQAHLKQQELEQAKACYEKAIALDPRHLSSYYGLSAACLRLGLHEQAREYMATFRQIKAEHIEAVRAKAAEATQQQAMARLVAAYVTAGQLYRAKDNVVRAEESFRRAITLQPEATAPRAQLALLYEAKGQLRQALRECGLIAKLAPRDPFPHMMAGLIHSRRRRFAPAEAALHKMIELSPKNDAGYRHLAHLYLVTGVKLPKAQELAEQAVRLHGTAQNYFYYGWACNQNGDRARALLALETAVELAPDNATYRERLAHVKNQ